MPLVKLETTSPTFLVSELQSSVDDDCHFCVLTSRDITLIREALFDVSTFKTRLGEWAGNRFNWTDDESTQVWFRNLVDDLDYKISGDEMAYCLENIVTELQGISAQLGALSIVQNCSSGCGGSGCGGVSISDGDKPATQGNVDEGEPPSEDYEITLDINRCNRVNGLMAWLIASLEEFDEEGIINLVNQGFQFALGVIVSIFFKSPIGLVMAQRLGTLSAIANALNTTINIEGIVTFLEENKQELVCSWYSGDNSDVVVNAFIDIADSAELPTVDKLFLMAFITADFISIGWFDVTDNPILNNELNNYSEGLPCDTCQQANNWDFEISDAEWTIVEADSTNGFWDDGYGFRGSAGGVNTSWITIVSDVTLSFSEMNIKLQGTGNGITRCNVLTSDEQDGTFTLVGYAEFITTYDPPQNTLIEDLDIVDKFVKVAVSRFETDPFSLISEITIG